MKKLTEEQKTLVYLAFRSWNGIDAKTCKRALQQIDIYG